jgi:hypothetical protein
MPVLLELSSCAVTEGSGMKLVVPSEMMPLAEAARVVPLKVWTTTAPPSVRIVVASSSARTSSTDGARKQRRT